MPRLSTSNQVKKRVARLLKQLLGYANYDVAIRDSLRGRLMVRWQDESTAQPKLIVQTDLQSLAELIAETGSKNDFKVLKEQIRHDLRVLRDFLAILDDNRAKTQGSANWNFTLRLWHKSTVGNLKAFEREWRQRKLPESRRSDRQKTVSVSASLETPIPKHPTPVSAKDELSSPETQQPLLQHNLPARQHNTLIGSTAAIARLLRLLSFDHSTAIITIEGPGGVGKTTLALEAAYRCLTAIQDPAALPDIPTFEAIIFTSAKPQFLGSKIVPRLHRDRNLRDIFRAILRTLDCLDNIPSDLGDQLVMVCESLARQRTLLMIDNLETVEDQQYIASFLHEIPPTVKVILTSRERSDLGTAIDLECLPVDEGIELIHHQTQEKGVQFAPDECQLLYHQTGGLPLAIVYAIGQVAVYGITVGEVLMQLGQSTSDLVRYCFEESIQQLQGQPAHLLLMVLTLFSTSAPRKALTQIALPETETAVSQAGLSKLYTLSLVMKPQPKRYSLHPLTREYVGAELDDNPTFEQEARNRWLAWYLDFIAPYRDTNWQDWQDYSPLEQEWDTLRTVVEWCKAQDRYLEFQQFWQCLKGYTFFRAHWHERLDWLDWFAIAAEQYGDPETIADALYHKSLTLWHIDESDKTGAALALAQQAWRIRAVQDQSFRCEVATHIAALYIRQQQFDEAQQWLNQGENVVERSANDKQIQLRQRCQISYRRAEIHLKTQDYEQAKTGYLKALKLSNKIHWRRGRHYIQGRLSAIAIAQGDLDEAERLLTSNIRAAEHNDDRRSLAFCQRSFALLEKAKANPPGSHRWAKLAKNNFECLNMTTKVLEMDTFLMS